VLVIGSGMAGLLQIQLARALGAGNIIAADIVDFRLAAAQSLGADGAFDARDDLPALLRPANQGRLADLVVVCTGAPPALAHACRCVERGGTILLFAPPPPAADVPLPLNDLWTNEVSIVTCYSGSPADAATAASLIFGRRLDVRQMITHRLGLDEIGTGFRLVAEAQRSIKVMIEPQR
jgi:L-iditol 2-dehydrogenase